MLSIQKISVKVKTLSSPANQAVIFVTAFSMQIFYVFISQTYKSGKYRSTCAMVSAIVP